QVERRPHVVAARKLFFQAGEEDELGAEATALTHYRQALEDWFQILLTEPEFRNLDNIQADTYEKGQMYLGVLEEQNKNWLAPLVQGIAEIGMTEPNCAPMLTFLPGAEVQVLVEQGELNPRRFLPLRKVSGPLEWVYIYKVPFRKELLDYLTVVTQPP